MEVSEVSTEAHGDGEACMTRPICHLFGFIEIKQKFKAVYNFLTSDLSL